MRHYAPATVEAVLAELLEEPSLARGVVHHEVIPARSADFAALPDWLDPGIRRGLASRGESSASWADSNCGDRGTPGCVDRGVTSLALLGIRAGGRPERA